MACHGRDLPVIQLELKQLLHQGWVLSEQLRVIDVLALHHGRHRVNSSCRCNHRSRSLFTLGSNFLHRSWNLGSLSNLDCLFGQLSFLVDSDFVSSYGGFHWNNWLGNDLRRLFDWLTFLGRLFRGIFGLLSNLGFLGNYFRFLLSSLLHQWLLLDNSPCRSSDSLLFLNQISTRNLCYFRHCTSTCLRPTPGNCLEALLTLLFIDLPSFESVLFAEQGRCHLVDWVAKLLLHHIEGLDVTILGRATDVPRPVTLLEVTLNAAALLLLANTAHEAFPSLVDLAADRCVGIVSEPYFGSPINANQVGPLLLALKHRLHDTLQVRTKRAFDVLTLLCLVLD